MIKRERRDNIDRRIWIRRASDTDPENPNKKERRQENFPVILDRRIGERRKKSTRRTGERRS